MRSFWPEGLYLSSALRSFPPSSGACLWVRDRVRESGLPPPQHCAGPVGTGGCSVPFPACPVSFLQNGELIYGCKDARSPAVDWRELAHHLKPFFYPSNGLASGPHCARAVIRELVRVITRVLLSGSDKGRASALKLGPGSPGPCVCEASPFGRSLRHQGRLAGGQSPGVACWGPAWPHGASAGAAWAP